MLTLGIWRTIQHVITEHLFKDTLFITSFNWYGIHKECVFCVLWTTLGNSVHVLFPKAQSWEQLCLVQVPTINDVQDQVLLNRGDAVSQTLRPEHNVRLCRQHHELYSSKECTAWFPLNGLTLNRLQTITRNNDEMMTLCNDAYMSHQVFIC